jgi:hypothetical protein
VIVACNYQEDRLVLSSSSFIPRLFPLLTK